METWRCGDKVYSRDFFLHLLPAQRRLRLEWAAAKNGGSSPLPASWNLTEAGEEKPDVQTSAQGDDEPLLPELQGAYDELLATIREALEQQRGEPAVSAAEPEEQEIEEMPKMTMTAAEKEQLDKSRNIEVEVSEAEQQRILAARGPRRYGLDDFEPENWARLTDAEKADAKRQVTEISAKAQRGE